MSKTRIFAITLVLIMLAAVFTNPSKEKMEAALSTKAKDILQKQLKYEDKGAVELGMMLFGDQVIREFVNSYTTTSNYYLFSLSKINWNGEKVIVGGGAFGQVWISPKLDEKADKLIEVLKNQ
ncbi:DUF4359 domain-containing protein [Sphingobacterium sp. CZ-2]|uniref:DUF4359 domain-containing protein n=1 Tax=Sphingobacterium sp. CZ-2 TaxID=2557994 RepID=UPI001070404D|nr:DUF4359 domain-containing protein [Sphingobacterium sp. CZ-2]QBR13789.1 DUF4359 domain-containing protein [Sphingobacterium sp. CZ-2]